MQTDVTVLYVDAPYAAFRLRWTAEYPWVGAVCRLCWCCVDVGVGAGAVLEDTDLDRENRC